VERERGETSAVINKNVKYDFGNKNFNLILERHEFIIFKQIYLSLFKISNIFHDNIVYTV